MRAPVARVPGAFDVACGAVQEVHLLIIFFLLLGTICVYYFWKSKVGAPVPAAGAAV